mmetsp:Transcript_6450/g.13179  ORF Transcript_6450/g.13179 Transcript_6450/m.13179 type:complete len:362 (-) Transcript_6450:131-1216(-)
MFANDSVTNLRLARNKRPQRCQSTAILPMDELRGVAAAKKRRRTSTSTLNIRSLTTTAAPGQKSVHFDLSKNTYRDIRRSGTPAEQEEDARNQWTSGEESEYCKKRLQLHILGIQKGMLVPDEDSFSTRGLEAHLDQQLTDERIEKTRAFIGRILQQQTMLNNMMGHVNPEILGKLSSTLSAADAKTAVQLGRQDARAASLIHNNVKTMKPTDATTVNNHKDAGSSTSTTATSLASQQRTTASTTPAPVNSTSQKLQELLRQKMEEQKLAAAKLPTRLFSRNTNAFVVTPTTSAPPQQQQQQHLQQQQRQDSDMVSFLRSRRSSSTPQATALAAFGATAAAAAPTARTPLVTATTSSGASG